MVKHFKLVCTEKLKKTKSQFLSFFKFDLHIIFPPFLFLIVIETFFYLSVSLLILHLPLFLVFTLYVYLSQETTLPPFTQ